MGASASLTLDHLSVTANGRVLLHDTSLVIPAGKLTVILGGSGAGKSVLLRIIAGLIPRDAGNVRFDGDVRIADAAEPNREHRVGIVFQNFALFDEWSAKDNVQFAIDHRPDFRQPPAHAATQWLEELRVDAASRPAMMSGGQRQRLAIARTLAAQPSVVLYDEPTSGLDPATGVEVAKLIALTHHSHDQTSIVVTHDYSTLLAIADHCLLMDWATASLSEIPRDQWPEIASRLRPVQLIQPQNSQQDEPVAFDFVAAIGRGWLSMGTTIGGWSQSVGGRFEWSWAWRFFIHILRLICGPSSWGYLAMAGAIVGFTSTYFTFRFLPFELYTKPLLIEDLLGSVGFALYRILVPVLATILIAARCGAAIAADVGVKRYGSQVDALRTLGVRPAAYLLWPTLAAFLVATPFLEWIAFVVARWVSLACFIASHPQLGPYFWQQHFTRNLQTDSTWWYMGAGWVLLKSVACGLGIAGIAYAAGLRPKSSAGDVSAAITATVLWSTLYVLLVHFTVALLEF